ncbi:MAG: ABC transporter ATP-binding protein, partial [Clostridia bacterium]|nr:ABC transporter ATP-binding protein [Clostridia bacterium]
MDNKTTSQKLKFFGLGKLVPYVSRYKYTFFSMVIASLLMGVINSVIALFQSYAIDNFIAGNTLDGFTPFILAYVAFIVFMTFTGYIGDRSCCKLEMVLLRDMRTTAFNHLQTLSVAYFNINSVGKIHARVMSDTASISSILAWDVKDGVYSLIYSVVAIITMFVLNPLLALCVAVIVPVVAVISVYFQRKLTRLNRRVREINSEIVGDFNEGITGVATSKTLAVEDKLDNDFFKRSEVMRVKSNKLGHYRSLFISIITFSASVALALVLWYGGVITAEGVILIGTLSVFMQYAQGLMEPVQWFVE